MVTIIVGPVSTRDYLLKLEPTVRALAYRRRVLYSIRDLMMLESEFVQIVE